VEQVNGVAFGGNGRFKVNVPPLTSQHRHYGSNHRRLRSTSHEQHRDHGGRHKDGSPKQQRSLNQWTLMLSALPYMVA